jgi:hypothetical protein
MKNGRKVNLSFTSPTVFIVATWMTAICGGLAIIAALVSAFVGYQLSDNAVRDANVKIAEASARQKQAELELLQLRMPRSLDIGRFEAAINKMPRPSSYEVLYDANSPDAPMLASTIWGILFSAKWPTQQTRGEEPLKAPPPDILPYANMPWTQAAGGAPWGVSVVTTTGPDFEKDPLAIALIKALGEAIKGPPSGMTLGYQTSEPLPSGAVRIIIGPKTP